MCSALVCPISTHFPRFRRAAPPTQFLSSAFPWLVSVRSGLLCVFFVLCLCNSFLALLSAVLSLPLASQRLLRFEMSSLVSFTNIVPPALSQHVLCCLLNGLASVFDSNVLYHTNLASHCSFVSSVLLFCCCVVVVLLLCCCCCCCCGSWPTLANPTLAKPTLASVSVLVVWPTLAKTGLLCGCCVVVVWLLWCCCGVVVVLLWCCCVVVVLLLCCCCVVVVLLLWVMADFGQSDFGQTDFGQTDFGQR